MAFLLKDYTDLKEIARGGMGKVYLGTQISLNRKVIIKEMASGLLADPTEIKRFENEARAAAALDHDNIIRIYDFGEDRGSFYITMEYIDGADLDTLLCDRYYVPEIALMIVLQALKGLAFAHQHQIIHRDIKPGNILISKVGAVKVVDFGLAHASQQQLHLTATDMIVGTPMFMSPEQATGEEKKDRRMDIWSVGVLLYRIVTNTYPFVGDNVPSLLVKIIQNKELPVQELVPTLPDDLAETINKSLEKDRNKRLQSLDPLIEDLQNYFYNIGIKDTVGWIKKHQTAPGPCVKEFSQLLLEYHIRKENDSRAKGDDGRATLHLREAKRYDSPEMPMTIVRESIKKRDSSSVMKTATRAALKTQTSSWSAGPHVKIGLLSAILVVILAALVVAIVWIQRSPPEKDMPLIAAKQSAQTLVSVQKSIDSAPPQPSQLPIDSLQSVMTGPDTPNQSKPVPSPLPKHKTIKPRPAGSKQPSPVTVTLTPDAKTEPSHPLPAADTPATVAPQPQFGTVKVIITPTSATVAIDGEPMTARDLTDGRRTKPGTHSLTAIAPGYRQFAKSISVDRGATQIITVDLVQQEIGMGSVHIHASPWAEVYIDGVFKGNAPTPKPLALAEGKHTISLKRDGFKSYEEQVEIVSGELKRIKAKLEEAGK